MASSLSISRFQPSSMGFGLPDDGLHSPNEKYKVANYYKGITTIAHFLELYGKS
ncbi:MAG: hypothetical protein WKF37_06950 [Bryobacteraceae bacterium]